MRIHVEQDVYDSFNRAVHLKGISSFEDWIQVHADRLNEMIVESGMSMRIDNIVVEPNGILPRGATHAPHDILWDGRWGFETDEWCENTCPNKIAYWAMRIQPSLVHEWAHQLGFAHMYDANVLPADNAITGERLNLKNPEVTGGQDDIGISAETGIKPPSYILTALASTKDYRRGYYGEYLFDTPENNIIRINDLNGAPLADAIVIVWQSSNKKISSSSLVLSGTTNNNGELVLPNQPVHSLTTATGHTLKPNPFGAISVTGDNGLFLIEISARGQKYYHVMTIHEFNLAYWKGFRSTAVYSIATDIE
ncbi:MAG: hypothetical protein HY364_02560 [Candidatus Aenigmarchaeota archaeon]|nr:hypothetical protein [Candidatus Aenigmarchaeota archaeon]